MWAVHDTQGHMPERVQGWKETWDQRSRVLPSQTVHGDEDAVPLGCSTLVAA